VRDMDVAKVYLDVIYVAMTIHVRCKCFYLDVAYVVVLYTYVASICSKIFYLLQTYVIESVFMLQVFYEQVQVQVVPCVHVFISIQDP
jgi:hypothetical protein